VLKRFKSRVMDIGAVTFYLIAAVFVIAILAFYMAVSSAVHAIRGTDKNQRIHPRTYWD
jgi:hypothetical protein